MNNFTIGILGNDFKITTKFVEDIINSTNAKNDQEHIKMNIIINNKLLYKNENEIIDIIKNFENINTTHLCLCFDNNNIYNLINQNTDIPILNSNFINYEKSIIKNIINMHNIGSDNKWKKV